MKKKSPLLKEKEILKLLKKLPDWKTDKQSKKLFINFTFKSHIDALVFIARITVHSQVLKHYPEIVYVHQKVKVTLTTTEFKGLTKKDFVLAQRINNLYEGG